MGGKRDPKKAQIKAVGWTGLWRDGSPGWFMMKHLRDGETASLYVTDPNAAGERFYRCEVTVRLLLDAKGRHIVRRVPKREAPRGGR